MRLWGFWSSMYGRLALVALAVTVGVLPLVLSERLMNRLIEEERLRMVTWAKSTEALASDNPGAPFEVLLQVVGSNKIIPAILTTAQGEIVSFSNIAIPEGRDSLRYVQDRLQRYKNGYPPIEVSLSETDKQYLYYSDSNTLKRMQLVPYMQALFFLFYLTIVLMVVRIRKRSEQNKIWVGLTKETAHQLGTPISALLAWVELMESSSSSVTQAQALPEMHKDIERLQLIANRFQKVGSTPHLEPMPLYPILEQSVRYLRKRISTRVHLSIECLPTGAEGPVVLLSPELMDWVIENVVKNAVDAIQGKGVVIIHGTVKGKQCYVDITDNGKGIPKKLQKQIFLPGLTTKERGWGLGLSLAKRIVHTTLKGKIFVKNSEVGVGTTIRIVLPVV